MHTIYMDHAATTPVIPEVIEKVVECLKNDYGNPSSLHRLGIQAEKRIKDAKRQVAAPMKVEPEDIIFTSGGTEANNLCIVGSVLDRKRVGRHCITTTIEHPSVLNTFHYLETQGYEVTYLPVDDIGLISVEELKSTIRKDTVLVSLMHVNNEIGSIQPIDRIGAMLKYLSVKPVFHVDAIQSYCKLPLFPKEWGIDLVSLSGHKIHAPKGIGAIYKRAGLRLQPIQWGGAQEGGLRSGTQNVTGIVGMGQGVEWTGEQFAQNPQQLYNLKNNLLEKILAELPDVHVNGSMSQGAPHILNIMLPGIRGEVLLHALEDKGVYVSTGSACSSRNKKISHVLDAIGLDHKSAEASIRLSISYTTTLEDINACVQFLKDAVTQLRRYVRR